MNRLNKIKFFLAVQPKVHNINNTMVGLLLYFLNLQRVVMKAEHTYSSPILLLELTKTLCNSNAQPQKSPPTYILRETHSYKGSARTCVSEEYEKSLL